MNLKDNDILRRLTPIVGVTIGVMLGVLFGILLDDPFVQEKILGIRRMDEDPGRNGS